MQIDDVKREYDHTPILWSELKEKGIELATRNLIRAVAVNPAMLTESGYSHYCKLAKSTPSTHYYQLVIFDKTWLIAKIQSEVLNPLGLESLDQLGVIQNDVQRD